MIMRSADITTVYLSFNETDIDRLMPSGNKEEEDVGLNKLLESAIDGIGANDSIRITPCVLPHTEVDTEIVCCGDHIRLTPRHLLIKETMRD